LSNIRPLLVSQYDHALGDDVRERLAGLACRRLMPFAVAGLATLGACSSDGLLPSEDNAVPASFTSYEAVATAYDNVNVGQTRVADLTKLGFDTTATPNVERLSYVGVMDRFLPKGGSTRFNALAPPVQTCIRSQSHCSAVVFHPSDTLAKRQGSLFLDLFSIERVTVSNGWSAEVIFLCEDGTVVYKVLQGSPHTREVQDVSQPLGPLQNFGDTAVRVGTHSVKY
jgi:hypothetical protein